MSRAPAGEDYDMRHLVTLGMLPWKSLLFPLTNLILHLCLQFPIHGKKKRIMLPDLWCWENESTTTCRTLKCCGNKLKEKPTNKEWWRTQANVNHSLAVVQLNFNDSWSRAVWNNISVSDRTIVLCCTLHPVFSDMHKERQFYVLHTFAFQPPERFKGGLFQIYSKTSVSSWRLVIRSCGSS